MSDWKNLLDKLFHPHRQEQEELQERIKKLQELSQLALEIDNQNIYRSLQLESNQLFMRYLTLGFFDGLRFMIPHLFLLALISSRIKSVPLFGNDVGLLPVYLVGAILFHVGYSRYKKNKKRTLQLS